MLYGKNLEATDYILDSEYYFENGFRKVKPYFFDFNTFCKGRWVGRTLGEIYRAEFRLHPYDYYEKLRQQGRILLNLEPAESLDIKFKDNDMLTSRIHRHEGPVLDTPIEIIEDSSKFLVVDKPSSIPIHPCGRYRMNSLTFLLQKEYGYKQLSGCYRLDRPTSGLVMFAKTIHIAGQVHQLIQQRKVEKEYLCKVVGQFPESTVECRQPVVNFNEKLGFHVAWDVEDGKSKDAWTVFERLSTDGNTSIVICRPKTGRTHQIRVHLQYLGYPIVNDPVYNHKAWGPERFQHGPVTKNLKEITNELTSKMDFEANPFGTKTGATEKPEQFANVKFEVTAANEITTPSFKDMPPRVYTGKTLGLTGANETPPQPNSDQGVNVDTLKPTDVLDSKDMKNETTKDNCKDMDYTTSGNQLRSVKLPSADNNAPNFSKTKDIKVPKAQTTDITFNQKMDSISHTEQSDSMTKSVNTLQNPIPDPDFSQDVNTAIQDKTPEKKRQSETEYCLPVAHSTSRSNSGDWTKVVDCPECINPVTDPKAETLIMYLHAYRYKSAYWEFKTKMPEWAK
uniref:RNA pseudouridylate synthase domain-containing protein 2 n=1 Tax=Phallusia mammillata TaxID=59560 RepID=A0A6F9DRX5_9ASCI|nr:RNA pseudouridylate synthase domain-containing protein 2 [Phallusia mammillata]